MKKILAVLTLLFAVHSQALSINTNVSEAKTLLNALKQDNHGYQKFLDFTKQNQAMVLDSHGEDTGKRVSSCEYSVLKDLTTGSSEGGGGSSAANALLVNCDVSGQFGRGSNMIMFFFVTDGESGSVAYAGKAVQVPSHP